MMPRKLRDFAAAPVLGLHIGFGREDMCAGEIIGHGRGGVEREAIAIEKSAAAACCGEHHAAHGQVDDARDNLAVLCNREGMGPGFGAFDEATRAIDWIDDKEVLDVLALLSIGGFLAQPTIVRARGLQAFFEHGVDGKVGFRDGARAAIFVPLFVGIAEMRAGDVT